MKAFKFAIPILALLALVIGNYWYFGPKKDFRVTVSIGSLEEVKQAISRGADVNAEDDKGWSPLMYAVASTITPIKDELLDTLDPLQHRDPSLEVAKALLEAGAKVNHQGNDGNTPLLLAVDDENIEMVKALLAVGADANISNQKDDFPLYIAELDSQSNEIFLLLLKHANVDKRNEAGNTTLIFSAMNCENFENLEALIQAGADVNAQCAEGYTALMWACSKPAEAKFIELLLKHGARTEIKNYNGQTALHRAVCTKKTTALVELLIKADADINAKDSRGYSPLLYAVDTTYNEDADKVALLAKAGADLEVMNEWKETALMVAIENAPDTVPALLEAGAKVNAICADDGKTPLIKAVWRKNPSVEVVKALLKAGADTSIKDQIGNTSLDYARDGRNSEIVDILSPQ